MRARFGTAIALAVLGTAAIVAAVGSAQTDGGTPSDPPRYRHVVTDCGATVDDDTDDDLPGLLACLDEMSGGGLLDARVAGTFHLATETAYPQRVSLRLGTGHTLLGLGPSITRFELLPDPGGYSEGRVVGTKENVTDVRIEGVGATQWPDAETVGCHASNPTGTEQGHGFFIQKATRVLVRDVDCGGVLGDCVYVYNNSHDVVVRDSRINNYCREGVTVNGHPGAPSTGIVLQDLQIETQTLGATPDASIDVEPTSSNAVIGLTIRRIEAPDGMEIGRVNNALIDDVNTVGMVEVYYCNDVEWRGGRVTCPGPEPNCLQFKGCSDVLVDSVRLDVTGAGIAGIKANEQLYPAERITIRDVRVSGASRGVFAEFAKDVFVDGGEFTGVAGGVHLQDVTRGYVTGSVFAASSYGVLLKGRAAYGSTDVVVKDTTTRGTSLAVDVDGNVTGQVVTGNEAFP